MKTRSDLALSFLFIALTAWPLSAAHAYYAPGPDLLDSPVLLGNYVQWGKDMDAFANNQETAAYQDVVTIVYDREIDRPWGDAYFPEAQKRLDTLRGLICPSVGAISLCSIPQKVQTDADVTALGASLSDPNVILALENRWNLSIHPVALPGQPARSFDVSVGFGDHFEADTPVIWNLQPSTLVYAYTTPVLTDVDSYLSGFDADSDDFPAYFALSPDGVVVNDWLVRSRAMEFANHWKFTILMNHSLPHSDTVMDFEEYQLQALFDQNHALFESAYAELLPKTTGSADTNARFLKEKAAGDYPEEVYQQVAYSLLIDLVHIQSDYYALAQTQRKATSDRQKALESLLTLQRYAPNPQIFLLEMSTLAEAIDGHAAVLNETIDVPTALTYMLEQIKAVLGLDVYASMGLYSRLSYTLLDDELFNAYYLKQNRPDLYQELAQPDGSVKKIASFSQADQIRLLQSYLTKADGSTDAIGLSRMGSAFAARITVADLRDLAEIIHQARAGNFH